MVKGYFRVYRPTKVFGGAVYTRHGRPYPTAERAIKAARKLGGQVRDVNAGLVVYDATPAWIST